MANAVHPRAEQVTDFKHGRVPRAVREQQLLDLAERLFIDNGYAGFSIEELCREAGVSRPIVYDHFGSKDGIYLACLRRVREELEDTLSTAAEHTPDLVASIRQGAEAYFSIIERNPRRWSLVYGSAGELVGGIADQLYDLRTRTTDRIAAIVQRYAPHAENEAVAAAAAAISGAAEQIGRWWMRNPDISRQRVVDYYLTFTIGALNSLATSQDQRQRESERRKQKTQRTTAHS